MHLPDGFLDAKTALLTTGAAAVGVGSALRQVRTSAEPRRLPMLGLAGAFVFAAQMLNFPIAGGTSGHLLGGVLAAILLGPGAAVTVMTCVLIVQCLMFADGGLMALGANVFNMAIVNVWGGYLVFRSIKRWARMEEARATVLAAAFAGWFGTVLAAVACAGELALSRSAPWSVAFPAMTLTHMLIGIGEGAATGLITLAVLRARPDLVAGNVKEKNHPGSGWSFVAYGLVVSVGLAVFVAPFACSWPDGLEKVAKALGFANRAAAPFLHSPIAEYRLPGIGSAAAATAVAGVLGTAMAFVAAYTLARFLVPALEQEKKDAPSRN